MKAYLALTQNELRLAFRDKQVLFFNYAFPLIFFFLLSAMLHAERGGSVVAAIVTNVLVIGILGNGFFGAGIRAVQEREQNILRRFKVAPISPLPILGASLTTGLLLFVPAILLTVGLARLLYGMPIPDRPVSLLIFLAIGALAFRSIGLIIAAVSNSTAESNVLVQLLYMPMMFLSGAAIPAAMLPRWTQTVSQFMPAAYLVSGMQGILTQHESLFANWKSAGALVVTLCLAIFVAMRLFRWEKDEKLQGSAKLWVAGVMVPFLALGVYQFRTNEQTVKNRTLWRQMQRGDAFLIRNARIFVGDGRVLENGSVLVRKGRIEGVYEGDNAQLSTLKVDIVEASGKTVMPGLIDVHVHLGAPGGMFAEAKDFATEKIAERGLAQYLYSGVTTVKSTGDTLDGSLALRQRVAIGDLLGAELFVSGPLFTTEGGHGTEYFSWLEGPAKAAAVEQFVRTPANPVRRASRCVSSRPRASTRSRRFWRAAAPACCSRAWISRCSVRSCRRPTGNIYPRQYIRETRATSRMRWTPARPASSTDPSATRSLTRSSPAWRRPASRTIRRFPCSRRSAISRPAGRICCEGRSCSRRCRRSCSRGPRNC